MRDLGLLIRSLPYLRPSQFPQRLWRLSAETALLSLGGLKAIRRAPSRLGLPPQTRGTSPRLLLWRLQPDDAQRVAADATEGSFEFLGVRREYGTRVDWTDRSAPRLWRFELNGFGWAWAIAAADRPGGGALLARLIGEWRRANPPRRGDTWHPFVAAERLRNLLGTRSLWLPHVHDSAQISAWLWGHVRFVQASLERDIGGNHLIREATALGSAGLAFGSLRLRDRAVRVVTRSFRRQVLPDGGHEERSPSYHLEVLADLVELRSFVPPGDSFRRLVDPLLAKMADFAASMCHPDGQLAMFNDCTPWPVGVVEFLRAIGLHPHSYDVFPESGYYVFGEAGDRIFFDAGPPSPRDLPAHAHCDLLSIEVSTDFQRMIVDSGTGDYAPGRWRDYWRSTRAHNTVEVDAAEQSETWHSFRMARRASPLDVRVLRSPWGPAVTAAHDGYLRLRSSVTHRRLIARSGRAWVVIDSLEGSGQHFLRSFLHLHSGVSAKKLGAYWLLRRAQTALRVVPLGEPPAELQSARTDPIENWLVNRLADPVPGQALVVESTATLPLLLGWVLAPGTNPIEARVEGTAGDFRIRILEEGVERELNPAAWPLVPAESS